LTVSSIICGRLTPGASATILNSSWAVWPMRPMARLGSLTPGQLDNDLVFALTEHDRFGNPELVNAVADDFQRLVDRIFLDIVDFLLFSCRVMRGKLPASASTWLSRLGKESLRICLTVSMAPVLGRVKRIFLAIYPNPCGRH
jgi:hypothetical protein